MHHHHDTPADTPQEVRALLEYMLNHNVSHSEEVLKIAEKLKELGNTAASEKALDALEQYKSGNKLLKEALDLFDKGLN